MISSQKIHQDCLAEVYKELAEIVGLETMLKLYDVLKGQQLNFPTRLYASDKVKTKIVKTYRGKGPQSLAREFGYSSRWVQEVLKEHHDGNNTD